MISEQEKEKFKRIAFVDDGYGNTLLRDKVAEALKATLSPDQQEQQEFHESNVAKSDAGQMPDISRIVDGSDVRLITTEEGLQDWQKDAMALATKRAMERSDPMESHMVTIRRAINTVEGSCGHKLDHAHYPKNNCPQCWVIYFKIHPGQLSAAKSVLDTMGEKPLTSTYGEKFTKAVKRLLEAGFGG